MNWCQFFKTSLQDFSQGSSKPVVCSSNILTKVTTSSSSWGSTIRAAVPQGQRTNSIHSNADRSRGVPEFGGSGVMFEPPWRRVQVQEALSGAIWRRDQRWWWDVCHGDGGRSKSSSHRKGWRWQEVWRLATSLCSISHRLEEENGKKHNINRLRELGKKRKQSRIKNRWWKLSITNWGRNIWSYEYKNYDMKKVGNTS